MGWGPEDQERQDEIDDAIKNATEGLRSELSAMTQRAEAAESRIREAQEQEPVFTRKHPSGDFMQSLYAAPIPPADVAELKRENEQYAKDVLQLIKQLRYCIGIAERGTGRAQREDEVGELFLLEYVKGLERKLAEHQSQNNFDATRLRRLTAFCGVAAPDSDEELLQVAGVVIGSCLRVLEAKRQAVPDFSAFNEWMHNEIPSGTIIGDAGWWASRIYRKFIAPPAPQPETNIDQA